MILGWWPELPRPPATSAWSVTPVPEPPAGPAASGLVLRLARAAIGWMRPDEAHRALRLGMTGSAPERIQEMDGLAREAVADRPAGVSQGRLISPPPGELAAAR